MSNNKSKKKKTGSLLDKGNVRGRRHSRIRVKTAKGRDAASTRWLDRQLNDPYVQEANRLGYRSRAAFKLIELNDKFDFLKPGIRVIDLGAAPGGWSQVAGRYAKENNGKIVAIDLLEMDTITGVDFMVKDFNDHDAPEVIKDMLGSKADIVMSDMAANTTGHPATDHLRIVALVELAYDFAIQVLEPGGTFIAKVFQGGTEANLLKQMKMDFTKVNHAKPDASRKGSPEMYVVASGFRKKTK